jgi:hypothetical protein
MKALRKFLKKTSSFLFSEITEDILEILSGLKLHMKVVIFVQEQMRQLNEQIAMLVEESAARRRKRHQSGAHTQVLTLYLGDDPRRASSPLVRISVDSWHVSLHHV